LLELVDPATSRIVVDLRAVTDLDSSGLASLLTAYVRSRREDFEFLVVAPPSAQFRRIFQLTGVEQWLTLVDDLTAVSG
jgi:anti-anti-sigma factor